MVPGVRDPTALDSTSPAAWLGAAYPEARSENLFPIPVLALLHRITADDRYREAAARAADFISTPSSTRWLPAG